MLIQVEENELVTAGNVPLGKNTGGPVVKATHYWLILHRTSKFYVEWKDGDRKHRTAEEIFNSVSDNVTPVNSSMIFTKERYCFCIPIDRFNQHPILLFLELAELKLPAPLVPCGATTSTSIF